MKPADYNQPDFLKSNLKDASLADAFQKSSLYRARRLAIILGSILILALISIVYAYVQDMVAGNNKGEFFATSAQLNRCQEEAKKQAALAAEAKMIAEETTLVAQEQLNDCLKKK